MNDVRHVAVPTADDIRAAHEVVRAVLKPTPLVLSERLGVHLKLETFQPTGAFKPRGNLAAMSRIPAGELIVTSSAGNHALGAAWAAARLGRRLRICVPGSVSPAKLAGLARFDVEVEQVGTSFDDAEARSLELAAEGGHYLSSYNDTHLLAGASTLGAELGELDQPLTVLCPVGGGGVIAGLCLWAREQPRVRLVGVEAAASRAMSSAVQAGRIVPVPVGETIADGLAGNIEPGSITFTLAKDRVDEFVAVSDDEIREAIRFLASEHGLVAEGAGATALAAVLAQKVQIDTPAVVVVTGRNIALPLLASILDPA
ncbi:MAG TPA: pyridoxal-phosphate dependent enzyme [Conexibacter sp.]|nr:pyridoxal-phosphate dependent enzyme [Conexibacter sp.]